MRRWLLSVTALTCLIALGGCQSCCPNNSSNGCGPCGNAGGCGARGHGGSGLDAWWTSCHWHGVCDCIDEDQCIMRQPWAYGRPPVDHALAPAAVPTVAMPANASVRPM